MTQLRVDLRIKSGEDDIGCETGAAQQRAHRANIVQARSIAFRQHGLAISKLHFKRNFVKGGSRDANIPRHPVADAQYLLRRRQTVAVRAENLPQPRALRWGHRRSRAQTLRSLNKIARGERAAIAPQFCRRLHRFGLDALLAPFVVNGGQMRKRMHHT